MGFVKGKVFTWVAVTVVALSLLLAVYIHLSHLNLVAKSKPIAKSSPPGTMDADPLDQDFRPGDLPQRVDRSKAANKIPLVLPPDPGTTPNSKLPQIQLSSSPQALNGAAARIPVAGAGQTSANSQQPQVNIAVVRGDKKTDQADLTQLHNQIQQQIQDQNGRSFIMSLCRDHEGHLWLGCEDTGVWRLDPAAPKDQQWTHFTTKDGLGDDNGYALACDTKGRIWVGHLNHGVSVYNGQKWQNYEVVGGLSRPDTLSGPLGERIFHITVNQKDGDVWMATSAGLARYSEPPSSLSSSTAQLSTVSPLTREGSWRYYTRADGLPSDQANSLAFDKDGNIYVATQCDGIVMADAKDDYKHWRTVTYSPSPSTPGESRDGGTNGDIDPDQPPLTPTGTGLPTNLINDILVAKNGTIYAATDAGLTWSNNHGQSWQFLRGHDWADKVRGLSGGPPKDWKEIPAATLAEDYCTCLAEDEKGILYIGHRRKGYETIDPKTMAFQFISSTTSYANAILPGQNGAVIGCYGEGLSYDGASPTQSIATQIAESPLPAGAKPPTQEALAAMEAKIRSIPTTQPLAAFIGDDWATQGDWVGRYGRKLALLYATSSPLDDYICSGLSTQQLYKIDSWIGHNAAATDGLRHWLHWITTDQRRCLWDPCVGHRRQAEADDHGEVYPFTLDGPNLKIWIHIPTGLHRISFYFVNKDGHSGRTSFRDYLIQVQSTHGFRGPNSPNILASSRVRDFWSGMFKQFVATGPNDLCVTIKRNGSLDTICSGVFIDKLIGSDSEVDKIMALSWMGNLRYDPPSPANIKSDLGIVQSWKRLDATMRSFAPSNSERQLNIFCLRDVILTAGIPEEM